MRQVSRYFSSVQLLSYIQLFVTPWTSAHESSLSITNSWSVSKLMSITWVMPSNWYPLLLPPSIFPSIKVFSNESVLCIRWPKYWAFSFSITSVQFSSVQSLSRVQLFATLWIAACQASLSITISRSSLRLTSIKSVMLSSHLILGCPLLLLPPIPPSIRVFSNESTLCMKWPKYWSFSFRLSPSNEYSNESKELRVQQMRLEVKQAIKIQHEK